MARLALISLALLAAVAICTAPAGIAQQPAAGIPFDEQIIYHSIELEKGAARAFTVQCPNGWFVADGGLQSDPAKTTLRVSKLLTGTRGTTWQFDAVNKSDETQIVTVWVSCVRPKQVPGAGAAVKKRRVRVSIEPQTGRVVGYRCRRKQKPVGFGWSLLGPNPQPIDRVTVAAVEDDARITGIRPTARGYDVGVTAGASEVDATVEGLCFPDTVTTRGGNERPVTIDRQRVSGTAPAGLSTLKVELPNGTVALGIPGFTAASAVTVAPSLAPDGDPQLRVWNPTGGPAPLTMFVSYTRGRVVRFAQTGITVDTTTGPITITQGG